MSSGSLLAVALAGVGGCYWLQKNLPPPKPTIVGIDLGTTYSVVAAYRPGDGTVDIYEDEDGRRCIPSVVAFTDSGPVVGLAARGQAQANARNTVYDAKRFIGKDFTAKIGAEAERYPFEVLNSSDGRPVFRVESEGAPRTVTPEDVGGLILGQLRRTAERRIKGSAGAGWEGGVAGMFERFRRGEPVVPPTWREDLDRWGRGDQPLKMAVMSVPAEFNQHQRDATMAAAAQAGLKVLRVISEPTAAAMAYGIEAGNSKDCCGEICCGGTEVSRVPCCGGGGRKAGNGLILVFDFGGGTLDVSMLGLSDGVFVTLAIAGNSRLGGEDFTHRMYEAALAAYESDRGAESLAKVDSQAKQRLRLAVDQVKIDLSGAESVTLSVDMGDGRPPFEQVWTRQLFEETCSELFSKVLAPVERCALTQSVLLERNCGSLFVPRHS
jgi:stress 70 chaperone-associated protein